MALGKRRDEQQEMWVATTSLPKSQGHVFYRKLNGVFAEAGFDRMAEELCRPYYHERIGRPSIPPGVYFRMLLVGYFEGLGSQRGIAWRCADSLSLREFLGVPLTEDTPDHSSLTRVRDRLPLEVHVAVFDWALRLLADKGLMPGKTVAIDSTFLEANAAMKSIIRCDTGEDWNDYLRRLLQEQGVGGEIRGLVEEVQGYEDSMSVTCQVAQHMQEGKGVPHVESSRGFVEQQNARPCG